MELDQAIQAMADAQRQIKAAYAKAIETKDDVRVRLLERASANLNEAQLDAKRAL